MRYFAIFVIANAISFGQPVSFSAGFKLGAPLNDGSNASIPGTTFIQGRWTIGPTFELHLPRRFSLEFDALYRSYRLNSNFPLQLDSTTNPYFVTGVQKTEAWDFPLLLKYRFRVGPVRPFVSGGYGATHESKSGNYKYTCTGPAGSCRPANYPVELTGGTSNYSQTQWGPVAGVGLEFKRGPLTIAPEFRFNRPTSGGGPRDNRFTALVGFTFGKK